MKKSVKVCVRTRPTQNFAQENISIDPEAGTIQVTTSLKEETGVLNNRNDKFKFKFDHIFHNATQESVFNLYAKDTVRGVADGTNGSIMTYGQTGSGKTFTMLGDTANYEHRGVAARALTQLFNDINSRVEMEYTVTCSYMEIYNERIFDLLADLSNPDQASDFTIAEEKDGRGVFVRGLTEVEVHSENDALNLIFSGELARTTAMHKLNRRSNRSHSIFTVYLQQRQRSGVSERIGHSKLHLIDLAGSERLKKTMDSLDGTSGDPITKKESMSINQSLSYLEQCVVALARKSSHVPYRQSKLTNILKDCLGANCNTLMIACIWGESAHLEETVSTLRLASRMMQVQNEVSAVETVDSAALIRKQAKIIKALKQELLMHDALVERAGIEYEPYTPEQQQSVVQMINNYVEAPVGEDEDQLNINSYRQMLEICKQFKKMLLNSREEAKHANEEAVLAGTRSFSSSLGPNATAQLHADNRDKYDTNAVLLGESDNRRGGFSLGIAPSDARPGGIEGLSRIDAVSRHEPPPASERGSFSPSPKKTLARVSLDFSPESKAVVGETGNDLLDLYIQGEGKHTYNDYVTMKSSLKDLKQKVRDAISFVNDSKITIDKLQMDVENRKSSRIELLKKSGLKPSETEDIVDEEEFTLMKELREAKRTYKNAYENLQKLKQAISQTQLSAEDAKARLGASFADWSNRRSMEMRENEGPGEEPLDDQEAFDRMELDRVMSTDPESLAFFQAQKTQRALATQNSSTLKSMQKNKRFH